MSRITFFLLALLSFLGMGILIHLNIKMKHIEINENIPTESAYY